MKVRVDMGRHIMRIKISAIWLFSHLTLIAVFFFAFFVGLSLYCGIIVSVTAVGLFIGSCIGYFIARFFLFRVFKFEKMFFEMQELLDDDEEVTV